MKTTNLLHYKTSKKVIIHQEMKPVMTFVLLVMPSNGFTSSGYTQIKRKSMMALIDSSVKFESHVKLGSVLIWAEEPAKHFDVFFSLKYYS